MEWSELKETVKMCPICGERPSGRVYTSNPPKYGYTHCGIHGGYNNSWIEAEEKWNEQVYLYQQKLNKLTDEQIIKALECCASNKDCVSCPYYEKTYCVDADALDLIKRQKAEIETLREKYDRARYNLQAVLDERADHSEAIKEFAERLKEKATVDGDSTWWIANIDVDSVVKEMVGEKDV